VAGTPRAPKALERALTLLRDLGALDAAGAPTPLGLRMLSFPVHPRYARMLLAAGERGAVRPVALIAAIAQGRPLLVRNAGKEAAGPAPRPARRQRRLGSARPHARLELRPPEPLRPRPLPPPRHPCRRRPPGRPALGPFPAHRRIPGLPIESAPPEDEEIAKCVLAGFSDQVAHRLDRGTLRCDLVHKRRGELARESVADEAELLVANEIHEIGRGDGEVNVLLTQATAIREDWLRELFPDDFSERVAVDWDSAAKRAVARREIVFRDLALETRPLDPPPAEESARLLAKAVLSGECVLKEWDRAVDQWIARVNLLAKAWPDWELPAYGEAERELLIQQICHGAVSYKEIKDPPRAPRREIAALPRPDRARRKAHARTRRARQRTQRQGAVRRNAAEPFVSARIQELFGVEALPALAAGRMPLVIHILAPSQRPVQITKDLPGFWRDHYPRIKQELRRKYPKHEWR
jgi:ATP-dependent helicase HrpB